MAKKKEHKISPNEQALLDGIELVKQHPLFGRLHINCSVLGKERMEKGCAARVGCTRSWYRYSGGYSLNKDCPLTPPAWAHTIAHCMLHLCFGHFDAARMPGYLDENQKWRVDCNRDLWNMACDIYIEKFLADIKFGTAQVSSEEITRFGSTQSELKIYENLVRKQITFKENIFGTNGAFPDMEYDTPLVYKENECNAFMTLFSYALAESVRKVISNAANAGFKEDENSVMHRAANWFVSHYPLLGGIATGFKVIDTLQSPDSFRDVSIAAVNVVDGEIYVNGGAGLDFEEWKFVLAHEYLHAGLCHHARRQGRDKELWNVACDFVINAWLKEMQIGQMPSRGLLFDETLANMSAEEIYDEMMRNLRQYAKLETFRGYGKGDIIADGYSGKADAPTTLDEFCKNALRSGLEYHESSNRGYVPAGLIEEIKALSMPPIPWDVQLAEWFDMYFAPLEKRRSYARPSRRQSATPDIPRPSLLPADIPEHARTYGVIIDTSGSMSATLIGLALGAAASYSVAKEVPLVRVVFCDADAYDIGYVTPEDIAGRVRVEGRGGTVLQPAVDLLERAEDFPKNAPVLIITDGEIEDDLYVHREHAFLIPEGKFLPFRARERVFRFK